MGIKDRFRLDGIFRAERESLFCVFFFTSFTLQDQEKFRSGCCS